MTDAAAHWDTVYSTKGAKEFSWFQEDPATSVRLLRVGFTQHRSVLDVGAGESTLVESLLDAGYTDITVLDISVEALDKVRSRLGERATGVRFATADVCSWQPSRTYHAWHDRAVFHFLVDRDDRDKYIAGCARAVVAGGVVVLGTFAADGPTQCSGLTTAHYDAKGLADAFDPAFVLEHTEREEHVTPWGTIQPFTWVVL
ncbi:MAG: class I SAM-dependent methyltransferase, partial [Candidatus Dormibacteria bacterium]